MPSVNTAIFGCPAPRSMTPMNFSGIGGGGGGPVGTAAGGATGAVGAVGRAAFVEGGAAFGLNLNRFRSCPLGLGRCCSSASTWTSGGSMPVAGAAPVAPLEDALELDVAAGAADVSVHVR